MRHASQDARKAGPDEIVAKLNASINAALKMEDVRGKLQRAESRSTAARRNTSAMSSGTKSRSGAAS
jgi:hypothetical protein